MTSPTPSSASSSPEGGVLAGAPRRAQGWLLGLTGVSALVHLGGAVLGLLGRPTALPLSVDLGRLGRLSAPGANVGRGPEDLVPSAELLQAAQATGIAALVALLVGYAVVAVGLARVDNTARLTGAFLASASILGTLLAGVQLAVFPAVGWVPALVLGLAAIAVNAAWLACAFHPPLAAVYRERRRGRLRR